MKWVSLALRFHLALLGVLCLGCAVPPRRDFEPPPPPPPRIEDPVLSEGAFELAFALAGGEIDEQRRLLARLAAELERRPLELADESLGRGKVRVETSAAESVFRAAHDELSESARADAAQAATPNEWRGAAVVTFGLEPPLLRVYVYLALAAGEERPELRARLLSALERALAERVAALDPGAERVDPR